MSTRMFLMPTRALAVLATLAAALHALPAKAQTVAPATKEISGATAPVYDAALARQLGADERGMRPYVLAILKTGPTPVPAGPERDAMFKGHFDNIKRMAAEGTLVTAGPLDGQEGRRGLYIFAVPSIEAARLLTATDPVIANGEMVAEFHRFYGSAALMLVNQTHGRISQQAP
ncbi:MAG: hypothetical protein CFE46_10900 [Burkholderiales bacterium PBB6]|nr:MAG: hypothetical protein CFE46_10900 [Burkholderiales bacterium PBB6]